MNLVFFVVIGREIDMLWKMEMARNVYRWRERLSWGVRGKKGETEIAEGRWR
jgi:hypothetical protein